MRRAVESERARRAALATMAAVLSLKRLCATWLLTHAGEFDATSQDVIAQALTLLNPVACGALRDPDAFAGLEAVPELVDACRCTLAAKPKPARAILDDLHAGLEQCGSSRAAAWWLAVETVCTRLLATDLYKREVHGPLLPTALADSVRRVRKLAQASGGGSRAQQRRYERAFPHDPHSVSEEALQRHAYRMRELDAHTG